VLVGKDNGEALAYVGRSAPDDGEKVGRLTTRSKKRGYLFIVIIVTRHGR
jgi:hypothetical protein